MALDIRIPIKLLPKDLYVENSLMKFRVYATETLNRDFNMMFKSIIRLHWESGYLFENTLAPKCNASEIAKSQTIILMLQKAESLNLINIHDLKKHFV